MKLTSQDHLRIADAIAAAEDRTSGEVFCVMARSVSSYRDVVLGWAAAAALILPLALIPVGFHPAWLPWLGEGWTAGHMAANPASMGVILSIYAAVQAVVFLIVLLLGTISPIRRLMVPRGIRRKRVHHAAMQQFLAHGLHVTQDRTGVLIFASDWDHHVEVVADEAIHTRVDAQVWAEAVAALAASMRKGQPGEGYVAAIGLVGAVLAEHFPPRPDNPNELADRLVLL